VRNSAMMAPSDQRNNILLILYIYIFTWKRTYPVCNSAMIIRLIYNNNYFYIFTWKRTYPVCSSAINRPATRNIIYDCSYIFI